MEAEGWLLENCFSSETEGFLQTDELNAAESNVSASTVLPLSTYFTSQIVFTPGTWALSTSLGIKICISDPLD